LSIGLKKHAKMMAVAVALSLVCLVVVRTGVAEAQHADGVNTDSAITESLFAPEPSERLEAYIGDSLRSISRRELGPRANPAQIATEAEQIFETNRHRLGDGSSLRTPGEELFLPPVTEPATNPPGNDSENTPEAGEPAASASVEPAAEPAAVSETSEPVESAVGASSGMPKASWLNERRLVGLGVLVLTLAFTILILWKKLMDRHVKRGVGDVRISEPPNSSESLYKRGESRTAGRTFSDPRDLRWVRRRASGKRAS
jgi:hypothetical protein